MLFAVPIAVKNDAVWRDAGRGSRGRTPLPRPPPRDHHGDRATGGACHPERSCSKRRWSYANASKRKCSWRARSSRPFIPESLPEFDDWELAARWKTARQVGGDFYDVFDLPDNKLGLFIADVADKGVPAALFMALTRTLVRAAVIATDSPAEALRRVNELLVPDTRQGMFVTAVYAVLDMNNNELTYVNAGHNPPVWVKCDGSLEILTRTGVALGAAENMKYEQRVIPLEQGR
ncbi:MAG: serine/threonine-protein phosphatase [Ignavibacteriales bacterium]|nr:serine/threonine-protein phosphatase [Ignavibacteriales bacterium]